MKQKQKQSVVIKNVINIGERKKRMNKRQKRARTQPKDGRQATGGAGAFNPIGVQFPYQKLFQPQPNDIRSLTMSSANSNEASNNVSALIDKSQQISEGRIRSYINNALQFNAIKRMVESEAVKQSGVRIDEIEDEDEDEEMPNIKPEPKFKEKKIDTRPIDLTIDEPLYEDMGTKNVDVEDISTEEKKDEMIAPVDRMKEKITPVKKQVIRAKGTPEQQKKANERYLKDKAVREAKKRKELEGMGSSLLETEYNIPPSK